MYEFGLVAVILLLISAFSTKEHCNYEQRKCKDDMYVFIFMFIIGLVILSIILNILSLIFFGLPEDFGLGI